MVSFEQPECGGTGSSWAVSGGFPDMLASGSGWFHYPIVLKESADNPEPRKTSIFSQPIFLLAILLIVFNIGLYLWSMTRDGKEAEEANQGIDKRSEELEKSVP